MNLVTPTPAVPVISDRPRAAVGGVVEPGGEASEGLLAPDEARARVPGGHERILGPVRSA